MNLEDLTPDIALRLLLDERARVQTSATQSHTIRCYEDGKQPNKGLSEEFLTIQSNGVINSLTTPVDLFRGNLILTLYCKSNPDGTAKRARLRQMVSSCVRLFDRKCSQGFFFWLAPDNVIVPTTVNLSTGYAVMAINIKWKEVR